MSLVDYPDSASGDDEEEEKKSPDVSAQAAQSAAKSMSKRKHSESTEALPPLPPAFHDLYAANARVSTSDNPGLHGGRKRAVPHVEGKWPSHVYLEWIPTQPEAEALHSLIQHVKESIALQNERRTKKLPVPEIVPSLQSELGASLPLHVSLSRTLQIKTDDREPFLKSLSVCLRRCAVRAFHFEFQNLKWVPNFERSRWFLVLGIKKPGLNQLNRLLQACNDATQYSGHSDLYTGGVGDGPMENFDSNDGPKRRKVDKNEPHSHDYSQYFHVSIAWNLAEPDTEWTTLVQDIDASTFIQAPEAAFDAVKVRVGNTVHNIALASKRPGFGKGGGGLGLG